ncbi:MULTISPECIES: phosphosulfolactate synthase [unclassified Pseudonocardia]|uniref:phosphosulfolactate synthase n=1 Tax=unclassified Pseudonocardia TaxID=2619320 RepID=UPI00096889E1|nr:MULTISPECIES: phosphosulfolactate synthase [unclassified Pseudonocardia]MBN9098562.1 phosphosulfolactate synthase [Pseudonocardia sp.]OJY45450.1 MAG: phosphosulfolactate synthase [Pseudonocardia sp. 73-21]
MIDTRLTLPERDCAPRQRGLTMVIDPGLHTGRFEDAIDSVGEYIDMVKFGWGTALVTHDIKRKIDILRWAGIDFYFGGTLFERFAVDGMVDDWRELCRSLGASCVEVSNGTIAMGNDEKAGWVARLSDEFTVISEVGFKDAARSEALSSPEWISSIRQDLAAGAKLVTTEARESGRSGICTPDGQPRDELIEAILDSGVDVDRLLFEAPNKELQTYFVRRLGPSVNVGNIHAEDVIPLETLRLGLRSDTLGLV